MPLGSVETVSDIRYRKTPYLYPSHHMLFQVAATEPEAALLITSTNNTLWN